MDTKKVTDRIDLLSSEYLDESAITEIYGFPINDADFERSLNYWINQRKGRKIRKDGKISRYALEAFFSQMNLSPMRQAAASLGMTEDSLRLVLDKIEEVGLLEFGMKGPTKPQIGSQFVFSKLDKILIPALESLRNVAFGNYNTFCKKLHQALKAKLHCDITASYCVTSKKLKESEPDYAQDICKISNEPIGLRYNVWLNFDKPINLIPDKCSYVTYFAHENLLKMHLMDDSPSKPAGL